MRGSSTTPLRLCTPPCSQNWPNIRSHSSSTLQVRLTSVAYGRGKSSQSKPPCTVTEEVLRTVLIEIEGILNSKPLGYVSSDVADPDPVTPNMLLMGRPDPLLPQVVYPESELLSRRRWRHTQVLADLLWRSFIRHYLPALQTRTKWQKETASLQPGVVAMIVDPQLPRALWPIGRITKVIPGADGRIRAAEIQVNARTYTRPVARLVTLPAIPETAPETTSPPQ